jgi:hypothetical protein
MPYYRKKTRVKSLIGLTFSSWYFLELFALWMHANQLHLTTGFVLKTWLILGFETQLSVDSILELTLNHCIEYNLWGKNWKTHPCYYPLWAKEFCKSPPPKKKKKKSLLLQPIEKSRTNLNVAFKREEFFYKFCKNTYKEGLLRSCTESWDQAIQWSA